MKATIISLMISTLLVLSLSGYANPCSSKVKIDKHHTTLVAQH